MEPYRLIYYSGKISLGHSLNGDFFTLEPVQSRCWKQNGRCKQLTVIGHAERSKDISNWVNWVVGPHYRKSLHIMESYTTTLGMTLDFNDKICMENYMQKLLIKTLEGIVKNPAGEKTIGSKATREEISKGTTKRRFLQSCCQIIVSQ